MTFRLTRTAALAATVVAVGLGMTACGGAPTGAHSASITAHTSSPSTTTTPDLSNTAMHRAAIRDVSRDLARPTVTTRLVSRTATAHFQTVRRYDAALAAGTSRVQQPGINGAVTVTYRQQLVGSTVTRSTIVKRVVTTRPVDRVVVLGTKPATPAPVTQPSGGLDLSRSAMWDRIAQCESTGNWHINTGNGYYGGLQFDIGTWLSAGGGRFAPRPDLASRAEQITIANHVYAARGLSPWSCAGAA